MTDPDKLGLLIKTKPTLAKLNPFTKILDPASKVIGPTWFSLSNFWKFRDFNQGFQKILWEFNVIKFGLLWTMLPWDLCRTSGTKIRRRLNYFGYRECTTHTVFTEEFRMTPSERVESRLCPSKIRGVLQEPSHTGIPYCDQNFSEKAIVSTHLTTLSGIEYNTKWHQILTARVPSRVSSSFPVIFSRI